jgi:uncharacterized linocin/CFP29 family protein
MNNLYRGLAPICAEAWQEIEEEARRTLKVSLAARRIVDFTGPLGWEKSAVDLGRAERISRGPDDGIEARLRSAQPLVELRVPFELAREELDAIGRGAKDPDLGPLQEAARKIAMAEDKAVFHGYAAGGITGMNEAGADAALPIPDDYEAYPGVVATAVSHLRQTGVDGPYAIALGPRCYTGLTRTMTRSGHLVIDFVRRLLDGPVVWAPAVDGAAVVSMRGGDFELIVGQDFSIGYLAHTADKVSLYLEESFTFRALAPEAVVPLVYASKLK